MKLKAMFASAAAMAIAGSAAPASAAVIFSTNFDSYLVDGGAPSGGGGWDVVSSIEGWTATAGTPGIEVQASVAGAPHSARNHVELDSHSNSGMFRSIGPGSYTLTYWYSPRPGYGTNTNAIEVLIGASSLQTTTGALPAGNTSWSQRTVTFTTATTADLTFRAIRNSDSFGGYLDDIVLTAVPEPGTWMMMLSGFAAVGAGMRRRKAATAGAPQTA